MALPTAERMTPTILVDGDVTWIAGEGGGLWRTQPLPTPADVLSPDVDLALLLARWSARATKSDPSNLTGITILLAQPNIVQLGWPAQAPADLDEAKGHPALDPARNVGWVVDRLGPWMTFHRNGSPAVHVGVLPWLDTQTFELIDTDPVTMAYRMQWMQAALGSAFRARPGVTAIAGMRTMIKGRTPYFRPHWDHVEPVGRAGTRMRWEAPYIWTSPSSEVLQLDHKWLHGWDIRGCFLAAASAAELGRDALRHTKMHEFDGTSAGYWKVVVPPWNLDRVLPHPAGQNYKAGDIAWITTPRLRLLLKLASVYGVISEPEVLDSWTSPDKPARILRPWAERLRDMVVLADLEPDQDDAAVLKRALKHAYSHAIAMLRSEDASIQRTDWNDTINGEAFSSFFLKLFLQYLDDGRTPVQIFHDMAYFASDETDPEKDRPGTFDTSGKIGRFTPKKVVEL